MTEIHRQAQNIIKSLNKSVNDELDKKKRLGQYAVIWRGGKVTYLFKEKKGVDKENDNGSA